MFFVLFLTSLMLYVPCIFHVYCSQTNFVLVSSNNCFKKRKRKGKGKTKSIDPKKRYEYMTIDIQFKFDNKSSQYKNLYHIQNYLNGIYYIGLNTK